MEINGVKIQVPEGMESYIVDGEVRFRKKLSINDVYKELFFNRPIYYMDDTGWAHERNDNFDSMIPLDDREFRNNCTSEKQVEKLLAIIQLMNVAKYLNKDWSPNWEDSYEPKYYIECHQTDDELTLEYTCKYNHSIVYFRTKELAQQAICILGKETIKLALSTNW